jgi:tartrate dehydrogenase/decarboxylase / D-malate dehydrogenase
MRWAARKRSAIVKAIENVLQKGPKTPDLGGKANTTDLVQAEAEMRK